MYRIKGNKIFDGDQEIQLFGVNWIGFELTQPCFHNLWANTPEAMVSKLKDLKYNFVRIPIGTIALKNVSVEEGITGANWLNPALKGKKSLELLDFFLDLFKKYGIRFIFDLHYLNSSGGIPDLWYTPEYPEEQWLQDLSSLANRYRGHPGFVGIDIKNEPKNPPATWGGGNPATDFRLAVKKAFNAIDGVNKDILVSGEAGDFRPGCTPLVKNPPDIPRERWLPSVHIYGPSVWGDYPTSHFAESFGNVASEMPIFIGEFGGEYPGKDKAWMDSLLSYMQSKGVIHMASWGYTGSSGPYPSFGILAGDTVDKIFQEKWAGIDKFRTSKATFTTDKVTPAPLPDPKPEPSGGFKVMDQVKFITLEGPKLIVTGSSQTGSAPDVDVAYYNPATGLFQAAKISSIFLKKA